jgi:hypothetical protein
MSEKDELIKSIGFDQNEILFNILKLYNNGEPLDCDPTYSKGGFYNKSLQFPIAEPHIKFDVYPLGEDVQKIEPFGKWDLKNDSIQSICIDLPFLVGGNAPSLKAAKEGSNIILNRFSTYTSVDELYKSYYHFLTEAYRVLKPGGICIWKTQRFILASKTYMIPETSWLFASEIGFYTIDRFTLAAKTRLISGKVKHQEHSRSFDSQFYVFVKPDGKAKTRPTYDFQATFVRFPKLKIELYSNADEK